MSSLVKFWGWAKLNAVFLSIGITLLLLAVGFSYMTGRGHGKEACTAEYAQRDADHATKVAAYVKTINDQNVALAKKHAAENRATDTAVEGEVKTIFKTIQQIVEVPVYVEGPCNIDHGGVVRVLDGSIEAAFGG